MIRLFTHCCALGCSKRVTSSEMGITNGIDIFHGHSGGINIMTSNNDNVVRVFDTESFRCQRCVLPLIIHSVSTLVLHFQAPGLLLRMQR